MNDETIIQLHLQFSHARSLAGNISHSQRSTLGAENN